MPKKAKPVLSLGINPDLLKIILKEEMQKRNWSNYRLSNESGVSQSSVSDHFNEGKNVIPSNDAIDRYCNALGISHSDLVIRAEYYKSKKGELLPILWEKIEKMSKSGHMELLEYCDKIIIKEEHKKAHDIYDDEDDE